jgi:hypothetical protein
MECHFIKAKLLFWIGIAFLDAVTLPGFIQNERTHEQIRSFRWGNDVNIVINAPGNSSLCPEKETLILFYACPAGNTIEWTIGKELKTGDDWHYDIQHIGAQTRFLREVQKNKNIITVYIQNDARSWSRYSDLHPLSFAEQTENMIKDVLEIFSGLDYKVTLSGHSAGGTWILNYLQGIDVLPPWIDRLAFLDGNYNYKFHAAHYDRIFERFLTDRNESHICILAYNDSIALYQGRPFISPEGGTWWNTRFLISRLDPVFAFISKTTTEFREYRSHKGRFTIILKENPERAILHTTQVYRNGFIHSVLCGTEYENKGYLYYGDPVYLKYISETPY